jgi:nicotinamidase-related amidase
MEETMMDISELKEVIDPKKSVLVVWDVQKMLVDRIFNREEFLSNTKTVIDIARRSKVQIFFTRITPLPENFESKARKFLMKNRPPLSNLPPESFNLAIEPQDGDIVINKNTASIFIGTNFELMLHNANLTTVVLTGISTEIGIESSARDALNRGYFPVIVTDAVSSSDPDAHNRSLQNLKNMMVLLTSNELKAIWIRD